MLFNTSGRNALRFFASLLLGSSSLVIAADQKSPETVATPGSESILEPETSSGPRTNTGTSRPASRDDRPAVVSLVPSVAPSWTVPTIPAAHLYGYSTTLYYGHPFYYGPPVYPQPYQYGTYYSPVGQFGHPSAYPGYTGYYGYPPYTGPMSWAGSPLHALPIPYSPSVASER